MTLVLNVLTPQTAIQVSDRRLVWLKDGRILRADNERNKAVCWCGRLAFSYTGRADLGMDRRTDLWLANALMEIEKGAKDQSDIPYGLARIASEYFTKPRIRRSPPELRRHAFVAVGWARFRGSTDFTPYGAIISNFHDAQGNELSHVGDEFMVAIRRLADQGSGSGTVFPVGVPLASSEVESLTGRLEQTGNDPMALVQVLAKEIRRVAARTSTVGRGLLVNVLPLGSIVPGQASVRIWLAPPSPTQQTYLYYPSEETLPGIAYGPVIVCGQSIMSDITSSSGPHPAPGGPLEQIARLKSAEKG